MTTETSLIKLDAFQQALAEAKTIPEVKDLRDQAEIFKAWRKHQQAKRQELNKIVLFKVMAERKLGEMIIKNPDIHHGGDRKSRLPNEILKLSDLDITGKQSHQWQREFNISEELLLKYIAECDEADQEASTLGVIRYWLHSKKPADSGDWLPLPEGKYRTLVIDPPWEIQKIDLEERTLEEPINYPTKSIDEIASLDIPSLYADDGTHIYLWTTEKHLPNAIDTLEIWGLRYFFTIVWHKNRGRQPIGLPQYNCEFALFSRTNGLEFLDTKNFATCFNAIAKEHSRKPSEFYELIKRISPGPRLDMFSREYHDGFEQYGNEVNKYNEHQ